MAKLFDSYSICFILEITYPQELSFMSRTSNTIASTLLLLSLSSSAWCQHGFYLGIGGGPDIADYKQSSTVVSPRDFNVKDTTHLSGTGLFGSLFGGYAWNYRQLYLAAEANIFISSLDFQSSNSEFIHKNFSNTDYKLQQGFGFSLLPGYQVTNTTLFYGRVGYSNDQFKISTTDVSLANVNRNLNGLRLGLGVNQALSQNFSVRMEYGHVSYQSTSFTTVDGTVTKSTKITPQTNQVEFGVIYNFA
jgi:outer membrane immunogenic protein